MISYAITVYNELKEIQKLLPFLSKFIKDEDEIVIVFDSNNGTQEVLDYVIEFSTQNNNINVFKFPFEKDFSKLKNYLTDCCNQPYIFNIDADEIPTESLITNIKSVIEKNPDIEVFWIPRINTVEGLTLSHVKRWRWNITKLEECKNEALFKDINQEPYKLLNHYNLITKTNKGIIYYYDPVVNFPDYQLRLYKNSPEIRWHKKVHESLKGHKTETKFPPEPKWCLLHPKEISKQEYQNNLYSQI